MLVRCRKNELVPTTDDSVGHLSFCDVEFSGFHSETQLSLVNPKVIDTLNLPRFGKVVVRDAVGDPVCVCLV